MRTWHRTSSRARARAGSSAFSRHELGVTQCRGALPRRVFVGHGRVGRIVLQAGRRKERPDTSHVSFQSGRLPVWRASGWPGLGTSPREVALPSHARAGRQDRMRQLSSPHHDPLQRHGQQAAASLAQQARYSRVVPGRVQGASRHGRALQRCFIWRAYCAHARRARSRPLPLGSGAAWTDACARR